MKRGMHGSGGAKGLKPHRGMKPAPVPMGGSQVGPGSSGGVISVKPPKDLGNFAMKVPTMKTLPLTSDRGAFKIKG